MNQVKEFILGESEKIYEEILPISKYIHSNPELGYNEFKAQKALTEFLENKGFNVQKGLYGLDTSFKAEYDTSKPGPNIAFMAEFDALPEIGHACGHNIIGTNSVASGIVLKTAMEKFNLGGKVTVLGTPAEENGSGKIQMIREGAFKGIDYAIIMHPTNESIPDDISYAAANIEYTFYGKSAHSAAFPNLGLSALNGVIQMFNSVNAMRIHIKDHSRIHGIITEGGVAPNIIPDKATCIFNIRSLEYDYLLKMIEIIDKCADGAAISTGVKVEKKQLGEIIKDIRNNKLIVDLVRKNMELVGEKYVERTLDQGIGSTDAGNVTHEIPAAQYYVKLGDDIGTHTVEFEKAAGDSRGERCLKQSIKITSLTGYDLIDRGDK